MGPAVPKLDSVRMVVAVVRQIGAVQAPAEAQSLDDSVAERRTVPAAGACSEGQRPAEMQPLVGDFQRTDDVETEVDHDDRETFDLGKIGSHGHGTAGLVVEMSSSLARLDQVPQTICSIVQCERLKIRHQIPLRTNGCRM